MGKRRKKKNTLIINFIKFCKEVKALPNYSVVLLDFAQTDIYTLEAKLKGLLAKSQSLKMRMLNEKVSDGSLTKALIQRDNLLKAQLYEVRRQYVEMFCNNYKYSVDEDKFLAACKNPLNINIDNILTQAIINGTLKNYPRVEASYAFCNIQRHFIIHSGDTNTGKTYNALKALKSVECGIYLAPLRLLALEICQTLNDSGIPCGLLTGEECLSIPFSKHLSATVEMLNTEEEYDIAVIDECQMIADKYRGKAWTRAILEVKAKEVHICCSPNAVNIIVRLIKECGDTYSIRSYERNTLLVFDETLFSFPESVKKGDALIAFSKKSVLGISCELASYGIKSSVIYGSLPPETRRRQIQLFLDHETEIIVATDAIGMGINIPIKRVIFMETFKYDGEKRRFISESEIKQIAGRAGRKNMYDIGYVNSLRDKDKIKRLFEEKPLTIEKAYYFPSIDFLLSLPNGTLRDRLKYCLESKTGKNFVSADISKALYLLTLLEGENYGLTIQEQYTLIFLPFSIGDKRLIDCWLLFTRSYSSNFAVKLPRHVWYSSNQIDMLEYRYKLLDLYYTFCKALNITFDEIRVRDRKYTIAERIQNLLRTGIKNLGGKCALCGKNINWSNPRSLCDKCFVKSNF